MHYKKGLASVWAVLITVVIMLGLVGGGYYYFNKQNESKKTDLQKQITDLEKQIADLKKVSTTATTSTTAATEPAGLTYTNKTYNFTITFDKKWAEWKIKYAKNDGITASYYVEVPTTDAQYKTEAGSHDAGYASMFAIGVWTKAEWAQTLQDPMQGETKLAENDKYVFSWSHAQACPDDVMAKGIWEDIDTVIKTFKLN